MVKRGVGFLKSRRGMSPLIATVLLIAFAVAMGAMIMNWSSTLGESPGGPDCSGIKIVMNPVACYSGNAIKFNVRNDGAVVEELALKITDDLSESDFSLKNSRLRRGDSLEKEIPYAKSGSARVQVFPSVDFRGAVTPCEMAAFDFALEDCAI